MPIELHLSRAPRLANLQDVAVHFTGTHMYVTGVARTMWHKTRM